MDDVIEKTRQDVTGMVKDYFAIGDTESQTLMRVVSLCAKTQGVALAGAGGVALAGVGGVTVPGIGAIPGWAAGALAGMIGGTTSCVIARRSLAEEAKKILKLSGRTEAEFKNSIRSALKNPIMPMNARKTSVS